MHLYKTSATSISKFSISSTRKKKGEKNHPRKIDYSKHVIMCHENHVRVALEWSGKLKTEALLLFKLLYGPLATLWEFSM